MADPLVIARSGDTDIALLPALANRHGCITGATGTGKTITLQVLAERFSAIGVPVFLADIKGDLAGVSQPGLPNPKLAERAARIGLKDLSFAAAPTVFWDLFGEQGHPIRTTLSEMGPLLLARLLELSGPRKGCSIS
jgi:DNA helicase HerA-like ATPase